ncbi:uncharacterized protein EDB93DRAFT_1250874 [Suillus bovinus]|uniref:uncharacterized protein n=1 Tax=Suillus bovinus TaxID=48563 RepID=UPI001B86C919|nr:uncharacterized protein EDB93DRAFT_1250874 [Suillus bovinus]KAG2146593.1 hypothetical protein EDB93DRAFT_1250874 [Suillus bovinus]
MPSCTPLAPIDVDRPPHPRDYSSSSCEGPSCGPTGHQALLLHHPIPQQQVQTEELWSLRPSTSPPPPHNLRVQSPGPGYPNYPPSNRQPVGPAQPSLSQRLLPNYPREAPRLEHDTAWDRRGPPPEHHHELERE